MPRYDVERYLRVRSARRPTFGPDGDRLAFLLDTTGVPQVWTLDGPGRWPDQLTFEEERVTAVEYSPTRRELLVGMDRGGDEREQLYLVDADDAVVTPLTDQPDAIHRWGAWSHDGDRLAYAANRRSPGTFDVHVQGRQETGADARRLYEGERELAVAGWSPDDRRLAVLEVHASYDLDVHVVDVETGGADLVTPHDGDVRYGSVEWAPDGEALYLTTDADADTRYLARLDLETRELEPVEGGEPSAARRASSDVQRESDGGEPSAARRASSGRRSERDWNVEAVAVHAETGRLAYTLNVDGYTELSVGELTGPAAFEPLPAPALPPSVAGGLAFSPSGDRLALAAESRRENANVFVVDAATGEARRWTRASTAGIPPERFVEPRLVRYESFDGREIPAFLSEPPDREGPLPVVVDIHGGPESQRRPTFSPVTQYLLDAGYAVFEPNVRGSTGYGMAYSRLDDGRNRMDSVADVEAGVDWLCEQASVDAGRLAVYGGSYGGFMALASLTTFPERWAAGVDVVGIANFVTFLERTGDWRRERREAEYGSLADDRAFLETISPLSNVDAIRAPLLVMHGENDPRVPVEEAEQIAAAAAEHVPVETLIFDDEGHGFSKLENRIEAYRAVVRFLDEHV